MRIDFLSLYLVALDEVRGEIFTSSQKLSNSLNSEAAQEAIGQPTSVAMYTDGTHAKALTPD